MTTGAARSVARHVLGEVRKRHAWASSLLTAALDDPALDRRDSALVTRLVYGVVATQGTLDEALDRHLTRPGRVHPAVRDVLRIAAYELLFARTPPRAAVHEAVSAARSMQPSAAGMTNAVLRKLADEAESFPWGDPSHDRDALARATGHPRWIVDRLIDDLGEPSARETLEAGMEAAPLYLAHNPFRGSFAALLEELEAAGAAPIAEEIPGCIRAEVPHLALRSPSIARGACVVADASSQLIAALATPPSGGRGVDVAAGRGTKTLIMQAEAHRRSTAAPILASDLHSFKVDIVKARMRDLGVPDVTCLVADLTEDHAVDLLGGPASADSVLVDVPCSNLGTLRRHPEVRWRLTAGDIDQAAKLAARILNVASRLVRSGGFVVYSTCTVTQRENGEIVGGFLGGAQGQGFVLESLSEDVPGSWERWVTPEGWMQVHPLIGGPDGHFAARMRRT